MPTQLNRPLAIGTELGEDVLLLTSFVVTEELGRPFSIEVEMVSADPAIDHKKVLGTNSTIRYEAQDGTSQHHLNGYWAEFEYLGNRGHLTRYRGRLMPWLGFLHHTSDCKIFQNKTASEIILDVFREAGFSDFEDTLTATYRTREYCVQYRESSFDFVSRLMEEEGIYYYFKHEDGKHTMVLVDDASSHDTGEFEELKFREEEGSAALAGYATTWDVQTRLRTGVFEMRDFDFLNPAAPVQSKSEHDREHQHAMLERFEYPGRYVKEAEGEHYATVRLQSLQVGHLMSTTRTKLRGLRIGTTIGLVDHPRDDQNTTYLIVGIAQQCRGDEYGSDGDVRGAEFDVSLTLIPATEQFRSAMVTDRPVVRGPQTAIVVGPSGEEIFADEHARVKVQFHWDRYGKADDVSSCYVRVAQDFAGKKWGALFTPRIGHEVIVSFLEGDPDCPLITGRVYNGSQSPPYDQSAMPTISTIKTNSSKGGGGFNEIRFEDKKGDEQIYIHAQKNIDILVLNDRFEKVDNDRHLTVGNDKREKVCNNRHEIVEASHHEHIKKDRNVKIDAKEALEVGKSRSVTVKDNVNQDFKKNFLTKVKNVAYTKAKIICHKGSFNYTAKVGGNFVAITPAGIKIKGKAIEIEASSKNIDMKAKKDFTLKTKTGGIEMKAMKDVKVAATANAEYKSTGNTDIKATGNLNAQATGMANFKGTAPSEISSSAILTVKGSLVKIN